MRRAYEFVRILGFFQTMQLSICHGLQNVSCQRSEEATKTENDANGSFTISVVENGKIKNFVTDW